MDKTLDQLVEEAAALTERLAKGEKELETLTISVSILNELLKFTQGQIVQKTPDGLYTIKFSHDLNNEHRAEKINQNWYFSDGVGGREEIDELSVMEISHISKSAQEGEG